MTTRAKTTKAARGKTSPIAGKVQTVLGPIEPEKLGITHTHEHILTDLTCYSQMPEAASDRAWWDAPVTMDRLGGSISRLYHRDNIQLLDERMAIEELLHYKYAGGQSIVDTTSIGIGRDPLALARISRATGLNIVMGGSHYVPLSYPADMDKRSEQSIADRIIRDITVGVGDTGVRQGIIGEIGNFWPMTDNQRKVLRASAHAQQATGAPISIHPGVHRDSPPQIVEVLVESGADPGHIIMGHLDSMNDNGLLKELMQAGCYLEWDLFAFEDTSFSDLAGQSYEPLNDVQRMEKIEFTIDQGFGHKIVIAHDVCTKRQYRRYGGKTYAHILENIVPRMRKRGFTEAQIHAILVDNPARVLAFK